MKLLIENFKRFVFEASEADYTDNLVRMLGHESEAIRDQGRELFLTLGLDYLKGKDLSGANLRNANLRHADLTGADLTNADLRNSNLSGVVGWELVAKDGANLRLAIMPDGTINLKR